MLDDGEVCNYADDTTLFVCDRSLKNTLLRLEHEAETIICWFESNYMKLNTEKCHLMIGGNRYEHCYAQLGEDQIWETWQVNFLRITLENQLKLDSHVLNICKKAGRKLSALTRMMPYLSFEKKRNLMKTFFESQFKYSPLVWMFHNRELNNKIKTSRKSLKAHLQ